MDETFMKARAYLAQNYSDPELSLTDLCHYLGFSCSYFSIRNTGFFAIFLQTAIKAVCCHNLAVGFKDIYSIWINSFAL